MMLLKPQIFFLDGSEIHQIRRRKKNSHNNQIMRRINDVTLLKIYRLLPGRRANPASPAVASHRRTPRVCRSRASAGRRHVRVKERGGGGKEGGGEEKREWQRNERKKEGEEGRKQKRRGVNRRGKRKKSKKGRRKRGGEETREGRRP